MVFCRQADYLLETVKETHALCKMGPEELTFPLLSQKQRVTMLVQVWIHTVVTTEAKTVTGYPPNQCSSLLAPSFHITFIILLVLIQKMTYLVYQIT